MDAGSTAFAAGFAGAGSVAGLVGADGGVLPGGVCACMPDIMNSIANRPTIRVFRCMACLPWNARRNGVGIFLRTMPAGYWTLVLCVARVHVTRGRYREIFCGD